MGAVIPCSHRGHNLKLGQRSAGPALAIGATLTGVTVTLAVAPVLLAMGIVTLAGAITLNSGGQLDLQLLDGGVSPSLHKCVSSFLESFARGMYFAVQ